jgi:hypothetical protein
MSTYNLDQPAEDGTVGAIPDRSTGDEGGLVLELGYEEGIPSAQRGGLVTWQMYDDSTTGALMIQPRDGRARVWARE